MMHIAPLVAVILTSSLLTWTAAETKILCSWKKVLSNKDMYYSFLQSDPQQASPSLRLYYSSWSGERTLLSCTWTDDAEVVHEYLSKCRERKQEFSDRPDENVDVHFMFAADGPCVPMVSPGGSGRREHRGKRPVRSANSHNIAGSPPETHQGQAEGSEVRTYQREKRNLILPGTLWCGDGDRASSYSDLGTFAETDSCCRDHDHCKDFIVAKDTKFGLYNDNHFTMSHCDCDNKFRHCLMEANETISNLVGSTYFNVLKTRCFDFSYRNHCIEVNWFGVCKKFNMTQIAEVHEATPYESPNSTYVNMNTTTSVPDSEFSSTIAPSRIPSSLTSSPSAESRDDLEDTLSTSSCSVYKDLDECRNKILPQQKKYGLTNADASTLYHCDCTTRLFQTLAKQNQLTELQALLLGHVSQSCFLLPDCTGGENCPAVLVKTELPPRVQRSVADMEEQRHLQAASEKARRLYTRALRRKDQPVRLYKLCLKMVQIKLEKTENQG